MTWVLSVPGPYQIGKLRIQVVLTGFGYLYITDTRASIHQWLVVPTLRLLHADPEEAHHAGIRYIKGMYDFNLHPRERGNRDEEKRDLKIEVFGHVLNNPIGTSAGIDKNAEIPDALFALGPAIVEVGGATPMPQVGNAQPRVFRIPSQNALINRYGLNSEGAEHVAMQLRERVRQFAYDHGLGLQAESERIILDGEAEVPPGSMVPGKLLAVQVAKNKTTPDNDIQAVARDYVTCVEHLAKYADILVVNVSSPNTPGLRDLQATAPLTAILTAVVDAAKSTDRKTKPTVMVKVSPDEDSDAQIEGICKAVWSSGVDGVIVGNTTNKRPDPIPKGYIMPKHEEKLLTEMGGYSGPQMFGRTLDLVKRYRSKLDQGPQADKDSSQSSSKSAKASKSEVRSPAPPKSSSKTKSLPEPKAVQQPQSASPPAESTVDAVEASVKRDLANLKPLTSEAEAASTSQSPIKFPERHSDSTLGSSGQVLEPSTVTSVGSAIAPPPSPTNAGLAASAPSSPKPTVKPAPAPYPSLGPITPPPGTGAPAVAPAKPATPPPEPVSLAEAGLSTPSTPTTSKKDFEPKVIFATGGITTGEQCLQILNAGASVCQIYTAMMYGGVGTVTRMKQEMRDAMMKHSRPVEVDSRK
ncbi:Dihydroorotate dehydrogenase (quinone), mitochondrial [Recurvomyces mirabilis]|nr:Dihydroorotate dehydrogenase (quinone), mitochondrial [Recurvomyces mirabilis]